MSLLFSIFFVYQFADVLSSPGHFFSAWRREIYEAWNPQVAIVNAHKNTRLKRLDFRRISRKRSKLSFHHFLKEFLQLIQLEAKGSKKDVWKVSKDSNFSSYRKLRSFYIPCSLRPTSCCTTVWLRPKKAENSLFICCVLSMMLFSKQPFNLEHEFSRLSVGVSWLVTETSSSEHHKQLTYAPWATQTRSQSISCQAGGMISLIIGWMVSWASAKSIIWEMRSEKLIVFIQLCSTIINHHQWHCMWKRR